MVMSADWTGPPHGRDDARDLRRVCQSRLGTGVDTWPCHVSLSDRPPRFRIGRAEGVVVLKAVAGSLDHGGLGLDEHGRQTPGPPLKGPRR
ncbi:hypothetical protein J7T55_005365 [Diaporthe amygdali]|uniref:uncharacterized protein n=1 Tax=Phomopsis amygdali TaxID=1214568 RepID=UPI0022FDD7BD|nr:uncharacterized protein J7T55_005365 [Diaporthe amygdali]KAJ0108388.1 hypothetical protein J7T55_005365 [Diaporthe amygdali]